MNTRGTQCSNVLPKIPRRAAAQLEHRQRVRLRLKDKRVLSKYLCTVLIDSVAVKASIVMRQFLIG